MRIYKKNVTLFAFIYMFFWGTLCVKTSANTTPFLKQQLLSIHEQQPFVHFNLGLSSEDKKLLTVIKVDKEDIYNNFYDLKQLIPELVRFFVSLGNSELVARAIANIIDRIVDQVLEELSCETAWVAVRCSKKQDTFVVPRWHIDGDFPQAYATGLKYKVACALKGPSTLFCNVDQSLRQKFCEISKNNNMKGLSRRQLLQELLQSINISSALAGEGTLFLIGRYGAIHSEPDINQDRIYLGILPGSKEQLQQLI